MSIRITIEADTACQLEDALDCHVITLRQAILETYDGIISSASGALLDTDRKMLAAYRIEMGD